MTEPNATTQETVAPAVVAAVMTALAVVLDRPMDQFALRSIHHLEEPVTTAWAKAGLISQHLTRQWFRRGRWG